MITPKILFSIGEKTFRNNGRKYTITFATELMIMASAILTFKLAATLLGPQGFGELAIARRVMNIVGYPLLLGLGVSLPKYIAFNNVDQKDNEKVHLMYLYASLLISIPASLLLFTIVLLFSESISTLFYGSQSYAYMLLYIYATILGLQLYFIIYGFLRGMLCFEYASWFRLLMFGFIPPIAIGVSNGLAWVAVGITGLCWILFSVTLIGVFFWKYRSSDPYKIDQTIEIAKKLLFFGIPRIPGEIALFGFFSVPVFFLSHNRGVEEAGCFSFCLTLIQMSGGFFSFLGVILLPTISAMLREKRYNEIRRKVYIVLLYSSLLSVVSIAFLYFTFEMIVTIVMGVDFFENIFQFRNIFISILPYVIYIVLRNPIDAISDKAYNSLNLVVVVIFMMLLLFPGLISPDLAIAGSLSLLAMLTLYSWQRAQRSQFHMDCHGF